MRKLLFLAFTLFLLFNLVNAQLTGPLSGVLTTGTYTVIGNISVTDADSLTIEPGTVLLFTGNYSFTIFGYLSAVGSATDSLEFKPDIPSLYWAGIHFYETSNDSSRLEYCLITGSDSSGIWCFNSSPTIAHCAITGNSTPYDGAGIACHYFANPVISNCLINENSTGGCGGGIYCGLSAPLIIDCIVERNVAATGGGVYCIESSPIIENCNVNGNSADGYGGGIGGGAFSDPIIDNCIISENSSLNLGGGIYFFKMSAPTVSHCSICWNSANGGWARGGGISSSESNFNITYCTIYENFSSEEGGGICFEQCSSTIANSTVSRNTAIGNGAGICFNPFSNITVENIIVEGNTGGGGMYFYYSTSASITYSDFYNNQWGNFLGSNVPAGLGTLVGVNINGDSCDVFHNIFEDPLFADPLNGNFQITWANFPVPDSTRSPCIDAGDPADPLDPDLTVCDIGALYFNQGALVSITLTPENPPIQIPPGGGRFQFDTLIRNWSSSPLTFDVWTNVTLPSGQVVHLILREISLAAGDSLMRQITQFVPADAPAGEYSYNGFVGIYPDSVISSDSFTFTKLAGEGMRVHNSEWKYCGWDVTNDASLDSENAFITHHSSFIISANPNPFNSSTTLIYDLPSMGEVSLIIYDIQGREVEKLETQNLKPGTNQIVWNAEGLPSGIYFARLTMGGFSQTQKLLLMK